MVTDPRPDPKKRRENHGDFNDLSLPPSTGDFFGGFLVAINSSNPMDPSTS